MEKNFSEKNRKLILAISKNAKQNEDLLLFESDSITVPIPDYRIYNYITDTSKYLTDINIKIDLDNTHIFKRELNMRYGQPVSKVYSVDGLNVFRIEYTFNRMPSPMPDWIISYTATLKWYKNDGSVDETITKNIAKEIDSADYSYKITELTLKRENFVEEIKSIVTNKIFEDLGLGVEAFNALRAMYVANFENYENFKKTGLKTTVLDGLAANTDEIMDNIINCADYPEYVDLTIRQFLIQIFTDF